MRKDCAKCREITIYGLFLMILFWHLKHCYVSTNNALNTLHSMCIVGIKRVYLKFPCIGECTVLEAKKWCLHAASHDAFSAPTNISRQESTYFRRNLQFKFLVGGGCAMFQIMTRFSKFQTKIQHYLLHRRLPHKLNKPFQALKGPIQAQDGVGEVNSVAMWLCCFKSQSVQFSEWSK